MTSRTISLATIRACPHLILLPEHYREDGTCRCDDPEAREMREGGYAWDAEAGRWT